MLDNLKENMLIGQLKDYLKKNNAVGVYFTLDEKGGVVKINYNEQPFEYFKHQKEKRENAKL